MYEQSLIKAGLDVMQSHPLHIGPIPSLISCAGVTGRDGDCFGRYTLQYLTQGRSKRSVKHENSKGADL